MMERIAIGIPCYGGMVTAGFASSLAASASLFYDHGMTLIPIFLPNHSLIPAARNCVFHDAVRREVDGLVWIDADIEWDPNDLLKLCLSGKDVVGATYRQKRPETVYVFRKLGNQLVPDAKGYLEVEGLGAGFLYVSKKVMRDIYSSSQEYEDAGMKIRNAFEIQIIDGKIFSEDVTFCKKIREAGYKIWLDTKVKLNHHGTFSYSGQFDPYLKDLQDLAKKIDENKVA